MTDLLLEPQRPSSVSISAHTEAFLESQSPPRKRLKPTTALSPDLVTAEQSNALTSADSAWEGDQGVLYWQENEIVGYYSDDPEDDGEGVNGIGYRQTAAQKLASARRRQAQLQEWKLREAADDRAKRGERRRGAGQADAAIPSGGRESDSRKVRFS